MCCVIVNVIYEVISDCQMVFDLSQGLTLDDLVGACLPLANFNTSILPESYGGISIMTKIQCSIHQNKKASLYMENCSR